MKILLLLLSLLLAGLLPAAAAESAAIVLLDDRESVTVNPDGTFETTDHCVYRILNYDGLMKMRVLPMHFNSSYGTLQVTGLSITKSDGRVITLDPVKNSSVSTENSQFSSEIFDPAQKVLSLTIPGLRSATR
ncbi:MAG: DUF3857 domain-containing protein [Lentisphaeria bacterium]|nr:DUF3857 domain-containing protein [Lentisphaeria bacterium]